VRLSNEHVFCPANLRSTNLVGVVDESIKDRVGQRGVADGGMPVIDRKLAGRDGRTCAMPVVKH
jgi:hypothetical protein